VPPVWFCYHQKTNGARPPAPFLLLPVEHLRRVSPLVFDLTEHKRRKHTRSRASRAEFPRIRPSAIPFPARERGPNAGRSKRSSRLFQIRHKATATRLSHLKLLEAESIHILREVASEFERPVMLYSIGKDSSVMLRLAQKAFYPGPIPFPLLHVDTGFKFHEMLAFRERMAKEVGAELLVWRNEPAIAAGTNPIKLDTKALLLAVEDAGAAGRAEALQV